MRGWGGNWFGGRSISSAEAESLHNIFVGAMSIGEREGRSPDALSDFCFCNQRGSLKGLS